MILKRRNSLTRTGGSAFCAACVRVVAVLLAGISSNINDVCNAYYNTRH